MFLTTAEIRELTTFSEVESLADSDLQRYIERADAWIRRATNRDYSLTENRAIQQDMRVATLLLVEYIWLWDNPELKEEAMSHDEVIRLGSYTVNKEKARSGELTGVDELDSILREYRYNPGTAIFRVLRKE